MIDDATLSEDDGGDLLDRLVPPPRPWSTRLLIWLGFATAVVVGVWSVTSGTVVPRLKDSYVTHSGGTGQVFVGLQTTNRSRVDIEIVAGPRARPGLEPRGYTVDDPGGAGLLDESEAVADPFPIRLGPGETIAFTAWFEVTDCAAVMGVAPGDQQVDLRVEIADGPFSAFTTTRHVGEDLFSPGRTDADSGETDADSGDSGEFDEFDEFDEPDEASWPSVVAQHVCARTD